MNIFILDNDPVIAAQLQCDKHVVKMIVESDDDRENILYKACHYNHPSTVWTRENCQNYKWHYKHFIALCDEYTFRYGKLHATDAKLRSILRNPPWEIKHAKALTPFKLAMSDNPECITEDAVESYRNFYKTKAKRFKMVWSKRQVPAWFSHKNNEENE